MYKTIEKNLEDPSTKEQATKIFQKQTELLNTEVHVP